jgi:hypothetical protein
VIRLGLAMQLPIKDLDELLLAAGHAHLVRDDLTRLRTVCASN